MGSSALLNSGFNAILPSNSQVLRVPGSKSKSKSSRPFAQFGVPGIDCRSEAEGYRENDDGKAKTAITITRRLLVAKSGPAAVLLPFVGLPVSQDVDQRASAVGQNMLAGRIPGLSDPDDEGLRTYRRPDAKSGGHGVGWSPIIPYSFKVPTDWQEIPVSIADLGGTEIDLRFQSSAEGNISVVVAPVLRFADGLGDNVRIEDVGVPQKVIDAFGPELTGQTVEGKVKNMVVTIVGDRTYYQYELDVPHMLISATAAGNRLYLFTATGSSRQWKKFASNLRDIRDSFRVG